MPEFALYPIFARMLTIIGAVSGILGIIAFFIQIRDEHKITISKRTAAFLFIGIIFVVTGLVLICENDQAATPESLALPPLTVDQVTLDYTSTEMTVGETVSLLVTVSYSDGKIGYDAVWQSSNPVVASVDSAGTVTALSAGTTQITARASENNVAASAVCLITVVNPPSAPTGYFIRLSTDHAILGEKFKLYVEPYQDDVTQIQIYTISPSGLYNDFPLSADGKYQIDTETGRWQIYASVTNVAGTYMAHKPEDYVEIEIQGMEDIFNSIIQGLT